MPELYKGQFKNFKKVAKDIANDPLGDIKYSLMDEEEKFNAIDEDHRPLLFFSVEADSDILGFCNIFGGITLRKSDGKVAMFFRYMYPNGEKQWTMMKSKTDGSRWLVPPEPLPVLKENFLLPFQMAAKSFPARTGLMF